MCMIDIYIYIYKYIYIGGGQATVYLMYVYDRHAYIWIWGRRLELGVVTAEEAEAYIIHIYGAVVWGLAGRPKRPKALYFVPSLPPPPLSIYISISTHLFYQPLTLWPLHDIVIVITNLVLCIAFKRKVGRRVVYCPIIVRYYCTRVGNAGGREE